jgi:hypothetical protein
VTTPTITSPADNEDATQAFPRRRAARRFRWPQTPFAKIFRTTAAFAVFAWWSGSHLAGQPAQSYSHATTPAVHAFSPSSVVQAASPAHTAKPTIQVRNLFDATEVFEFPAGTSDAETRQKVAEVLLQRARARRSQWADIRTTPIDLRTANLYEHRKPT